MLTNLILLPENTNSYTGATPSTPGGAQSVSAHNNPSATNTQASVSATYRFNAPFFVTEVQFSLQALGSTYANNGGGGDVELLVQYYDASNVLQTILSQSQSCGSQSSCNQSATNNAYMLNAICNGFYIYSHAGFGAGDDHPNCYADAIINYLSAFGNIYTDSGLRIESPVHGIIKIGCETLNSGHILRMNNPGAGGVVGIPLLSTTDPDASPCRISEGGIIYALPIANG